jgi:hypothetical protein
MRVQPLNPNSMNSIQILEEAISGVKFSAPQKRIIERLLEGYQIEVVNKHYRSGGEWMWNSPYSASLQPAGKVYKAFWNVFYEIKRQKGIVLSANLFIK